jgi:DNA-directed RNA polymerase subunit M/transcription elongation factor TFIIS
MILQETVSITLNSSNIKHYESLGYSIPRIRAKYYPHTLSVPRGTNLLIKIKDLQSQSHIKVDVQCDICGTKKKIRYYTLEKSSRYICSPCHNKSETSRMIVRKTWKNRKHTNETKKKMSENSGSLGKLGKDSWNWNPILTEEERKKHHCVSGIDKWKILVKQRDNHTCQKCGSTEHLCVHHLHNFAKFKEQRTDVDNGITFCVDCHKLIHKIQGKFTLKENFDDFIKII